MKKIVLSLFICLFSMTGCSADKSNLREQQTTESDESINLSSSQLKDFKVSFNEEGEVSKSTHELIEEGAKNEVLPFKADSEQCYSKVRIPAVYKNQSFVVTKEDASYKYEISDPEYKWEEKEVLIQEKEQGITVEPAIYKWIKETEFFNSEIDDQSNKGLRKEITVKKRIMVSPPKVSKYKIPAKYKTQRVKTIIKPSEVKRIEIPAVYKTVSVPFKITKESSDWKEVICAAKITTPLLYKIQKKLSKLNYYTKDDIDGKLGKKTLKAIKNYQNDNNLAVGQITTETLKKLGISK